MVFNSVEQLIGNTPMLRLSAIEEKFNLKAKLYAKLESFNPGGSAKDRVALKMISDAEEAGLLNENSVIIEPTSGNTGIGLSIVGALRGYKVIIVMPDSMSVERQKLMKAYGAELVLTPGKDGMSGAIKKAEELAESINDSFIPSQFDNPSNSKVHYETTGVEIYNDLQGEVHAFVAGVGTGGTITGVGNYLKNKNSNIHITAVEPLASPVLSENVAGVHKIQGIGAGFVPKVLDTNIYDEIIKVSDEDAFKWGREMGRSVGILVGISSGAVLCAAVEMATRDEYQGKNIVLLMPDTGDRYLSTVMFSDERN